MDNLSNLCRFCLKSGAKNPLDSVLNFKLLNLVRFDVSSYKNRYTV